MKLTEQLIRSGSDTGGMYITFSKDGAIRLWYGVNANCVRSIQGTAEATGANVTKDERFVLSSTGKLSEFGTGKLVKPYLGATHTECGADRSILVLEGNK